MKSYEKVEKAEKEISREVLAELLERCLAAAVSTKNRNWNQVEYQKGVVEPYRKVQGIFYDLENKEREPVWEYAREALNMVRSVFETKGLSSGEQRKWLENILAGPVPEELYQEFVEPGHHIG